MFYLALERNVKRANSPIYIGVNVLFKVLESVESECPKQKRITHVHRSNDAAICPVLIAT